MRLLLRSLLFAQCFLVSLQNIGLTGTLKVFLQYRSRVAEPAVAIRIRKLGRAFYFRGAADRGVVSHFYKAGYRIRDTAQAPVRYIVDGGANIGDETLRFRHFFPEATIVALEPAAGNFELLCRNTEHDPHIVRLQAGLWSKECRLKVVGAGSFESFRVVEVAEGETAFDVHATTISAIMEVHGISHIDILKLDIEGAEHAIFSANYEAWISKVRVLIVECPDNDRPGTTQAIFHALAGLDFNCYIHGENLVLIRRDVPWKLESDLFLTR